MHIEFHFFDACLSPRVIFCCLPGVIEQLHLAEILYRQTAPVIRCTGGLETAFANPSIIGSRAPGAVAVCSSPAGVDKGAVFVPGRAR